MASTKYSFVKAVDTARLDQEIRTSSIITALDYISTVGTAVDIWFKDALSGPDQTTLSSLVTAHVNAPLPEENKDSDGSLIVRKKETKAGWHFQLHSVEISTSTKNGTFSKKLASPTATTFSLVDTGYITAKYYDAAGNELTEDDNGLFATCVTTVMDWQVDFEMEIIGGLVFQDNPPASDVRLSIVAAPGIANMHFVTGSFNLKHCGSGMAIHADGRASKYISPTVPVPGVNKFRVVASHPAGFQHSFQIVFQLFKPL